MRRINFPPPRLLPTLALAMALGGCTQLMPGYLKQPAATVSKARVTPATESHGLLEALPAPRGKIPVAVYAFRDLTGQYKPAPDSSYSTMMTQGGTAILTKALLDSRWFMPLEREGLQNLLTERRIARSLGDGEVAREPVTLPGLQKAAMIIEGGIIGYESNVKTGGAGLRYFGIGASDQYRVDQITVSLRAVDVRTGQVLAALTTTKTVYSMKVTADVYRYVSFKRVLDGEAGMTRNEPAQLCLQDAIEAGVVHLVALGIHRNLWSLRSDADRQAPLLLEAWAEQGLPLPATMALLAPASRPAPTAANPAAPASVTTPAAAPAATAAPAAPAPVSTPATKMAPSPAPASATDARPTPSSAPKSAPAPEHEPASDSGSVFEPEPESAPTPLPD